MESERPGWDYQFRETEWERRQRQRKRREQLRVEGKCWQCAKPVTECTCPNIKHEARSHD